MVLAIVMRPLIDKLYERHFAINAFTLSLHLEKFWFNFANLLSIVKPRIVNSVSQERSRSGHRMLSSVMSISVPNGITDVFSRLQCRPLIVAKSLRYLTAFLRFSGVLSM